MANMRHASSLMGGRRDGPTLRLINTQRDLPVPIDVLRHRAARAVRHLRIRQRGVFVIAFVDRRTMRRLHRRFLRAASDTDVLSFRYDGEPVAGEVIVSPDAARRYAQQHGIEYQEELTRYVFHGLLHWLGHEDDTPRRQQRMRVIEDNLLARCARPT